MNWVGDLMVQEVVEGVAEPTRANRIMVDGEPLPLIVEMKRSVAKLTNADRGWKQINYFQEQPAAYGL